MIFLVPTLSPILEILSFSISNDDFTILRLWKIRPTGKIFAIIIIVSNQFRNDRKILQIHSHKFYISMLFYYWKIFELHVGEYICEWKVNSALLTVVAWIEIMGRSIQFGLRWRSCECKDDLVNIRIVMWLDGHVGCCFKLYWKYELIIE